MLKRQGKWVEWEDLVVAVHKLRCRMMEEYRILCMPATDNLVINGEEGPTLKGIALNAEEARLFHVSFMSREGGEATCQGIQAETACDSVANFWLYIFTLEFLIHDNFNAFIPHPTQDTALLSLLLSCLVVPMRPSCVFTLAHPDKYTRVGCDKVKCR